MVHCPSMEAFAERGAPGLYWPNQACLQYVLQKTKNMFNHFSYLIELGVVPPYADLDFEIELLGIEGRDFVRDYESLEGGEQNSRQRVPEEDVPDFMGEAAEQPREL